jgi:cation transporter-like permease
MTPDDLNSGRALDPPSPARASGRLTWAVATIAALSTIWIAVALISVFSPDLVSGSEQQHLAVAAITTWLWGTVATIAQVALGAALVRRRRIDAWLVAQPVATIVVWCGAVVVSVFTPPMVTGTDPTIIPLAAIIAPIAAAAVTVIAAALAFFADRATR